MLKCLCSIDYSLNSPSICIFDGINYNFISLTNTKTFYGKKDTILKNYEIHTELEPIINIKKYNRSKQDEIYYLDQLNKLKDATDLSNQIISSIPDNSIVAMEGFAYGAQSRSYIDLILFASILRGKLFEKFEYVYIFSPNEIKQVATGKGTASKVNMFESFLKEELKDNKFYDYCLENKNRLINGKDLLKPIDDLVDSYFVNKTLQKLLKTF